MDGGLGGKRRIMNISSLKRIQKMLEFFSGSNFFNISSNFIIGVKYDNVNIHKN
jgi:hypothetical protein